MLNDYIKTQNSIDNLKIFKKFIWLIIKNININNSNQGCQKRFFDTTQNIQYKLELLNHK